MTTDAMVDYCIDMLSGYYYFIMLLFDLIALEWILNEGWFLPHFLP